MLGRNMTFFVFTNLKIGAKIQQFRDMAKLFPVKSESFSAIRVLSISNFRCIFAAEINQRNKQRL
jgi:hypothetical protein